LAVERWPYRPSCPDLKSLRKIRLPLPDQMPGLTVVGKLLKFEGVYGPGSFQDCSRNITRSRHVTRVSHRRDSRDRFGSESLSGPPLAAKWRQGYRLRIAVHNRT